MSWTSPAAPTPRDPAAPPIVAVQLPGGSIADTSCASSTAFMLDAIRFVLATADAAVPAGERCPVVINLSIGNIAGPHDGSSIFEQALDELIGLRSDCDVVLAAGNSYQLRCHAWIDLPPGSAMTLNWQIQPGDGTPSFLELWFTDPAGANGVGDIGGIRLTVTPPGGQPIEVPHGRPVAVPGEKGQAVAMLSLQQQVANGRKGMGLLAVAPTQCTGEWTAAAPSGAWRVTLHNAGATVLECNAFVQRDDAPLGRPTLGRQSYLNDADYRRFDARGAVEVLDSDAAYVRRVGTLNGLASGDRVHVAGGALTDREGGATAARYSSVPLQASEPSRWRVLAVTEDSPGAQGRAGGRHGQRLVCHPQRHEHGGPATDALHRRQVAHGGAADPHHRGLPGPSGAGGAAGTATAGALAPPAGRTDVSAGCALTSDPASWRRCARRPLRS